ncbi:MAG: ATP-binding protein [Eubacteriales bacterium]
MEIFSKLMIGNKRNIPYESYEEQWTDCLHMIDIYLFFAYKIQEKGTNASMNVPFHLKGSVVLSSQMEGAFGEKILDTELDEKVKQNIKLSWNYFLSRIPEQLEGIANILWQIFRFTSTSEEERLCFLLAFAVRMDRKYERISGFILDDALERCPELSMAYGIANMVKPVPIARFLQMPMDEFKWNLIFDTKDEGLETKLILREIIFLRMMGDVRLGTRLGKVTTFYPPEEEQNSQAMIYGDMLKENIGIFEKSLQEYIPTLVVFSGEQGSGRRNLMKRIGIEMNRPLILVHMDRILCMEEVDYLAVFLDLMTVCIVNAYTPVFYYQNAEPNVVVHELALQILHEYGVVYAMMIVQEQVQLKGTDEFVSFHYSLGQLSLVERELLWKHFINRYKLQLAESLDLRELSNLYHLTPGQISNVVGMVHMKNTGETICMQDIANAIREQSTGEILKYCKKIKPFFTIEDLILPEESKKTIEYMIKRVKKESFIHNTWGFGEKYAYGKSTAILLYGKPGTGKSMCAHVLAHALELDLLKVDLSSVVNKYVGETEKNLTKVFQEASKSNAILFFDEADSLFSQRSKEVNGANDKYANLETAHLLQKLEEFEGICVLTTNMAMNFDKAFFRRFEFMINMPYPDVETRIRLWENAFPQNCPRDQYLPIPILAEQFELSPSEIKTIVRNAAFVAACNDREQVGVEHVIEALQMDFNKHGKVMPTLPF